MWRIEERSKSFVHVGICGDERCFEGIGLIKTIRLSLSISDTPTRSLDNGYTGADIPFMARVVGKDAFITSSRDQSALIGDRSPRLQV